MIRVHRIRAFLFRHLYDIRASIDRKVDIVFWPTIDLLTFGLLSVYIDKLDVKVGIAGAILGALILWTLVYNIQRDISVSLLEDAWSRNLFNLFSTPLRISEVMIGTLILSVLKAIITIMIVVLLALSLFHFNLFELGPIIGFYIFNIFMFGWAFGYITAALIFRFGTKIQTVAWSLIALIYPISGVFYPIATLPHFLAVVSKALPISYIFEGLRSLIITHEGPSVGDLLLIVALNLIYLFCGICFFALGFRSAKKRGWFIHPT